MCATNSNYLPSSVDYLNKKHTFQLIYRLTFNLSSTLDTGYIKLATVQCNMS